MKILLLNTSIKGEKSRSYQIAKYFIEGLKNNPAIKTDIVVTDVWLHDKEINECNSCFACWTKASDGVCVIRDDMTELLNTYINSDLVIWSFPLLFFNFPSVMKRFIERTFPIYMANVKNRDNKYVHLCRYDRLNKRRELFVSTCGFPVTHNNYEPIEETIRIMYENRGDKIFCTEGSLFEEIRFQKIVNRYLKAVERAGTRYSLESGLTDKCINRLKQQLLHEDLYEQEANTNQKWLDIDSSI